MVTCTEDCRAMPLKSNFFSSSVLKESRGLTSNQNWNWFLLCKGTIAVFLLKTHLAKNLKMMAGMKNILMPIWTQYSPHAVGPKLVEFILTQRWAQRLKFSSKLCTLIYRETALSELEMDSLMLMMNFKFFILWIILATLAPVGNSHAVGAPIMLRQKKSDSQATWPVTAAPSSYCGKHREVLCICAQMLRFLEVKLPTVPGNAWTVEFVWPLKASLNVFAEKVLKVASAR